MSAQLLLVDDELHILKAAEFKFKRHGFHVETATDGQDAWEKMQVHRPDILITDLQMPRMNGLQLIQKLRDDERFQDLPIVLQKPSQPIDTLGLAASESVVGFVSARVGLCSARRSVS